MNRLRDRPAGTYENPAATSIGRLASMAASKRRPGQCGASDRFSRKQQPMVESTDCAGGSPTRGSDQPGACAATAPTPVMRAAASTQHIPATTANLILRARPRPTICSVTTRWCNTLARRSRRQFLDLTRPVSAH
jgi:hypothetical protein